MIDCPKCKAQIPEFSAFCPECGAPLTQQPVQQPVQQQSIPQQSVQQPIPQQSVQQPIPQQPIPQQAMQQPLQSTYIPKEQPLYGQNQKPASGTNKVVYIIIPIIVVVIALIITVCMLMSKIFLKTNELKTEYEVGSEVVLEDIIETKSNLSKLIQKDEIDTGVLGEQTIDYQVSAFGVKKDLSVDINIVDTQEPVIIGEDSLTFIGGDDLELDWKDYYSVEDFETGLEKDIESDDSIDTSVEDDTKIKLSVEDSSGNVGTKEIVVKIIVPTDLEKIAMRVVDLCEESQDVSDDSIDSIYMLVPGDSGLYVAKLNNRFFIYNEESDEVIDMDEVGSYSYITSYMYEYIVEEFNKTSTEMDLDRIMGFRKGNVEDMDA